MHDSIRRPRPPSAAVAARLLALLLCAVLANACAATARHGLSPSASAAAPQLFAPDPTLQRLIDPYPAAHGVSWLGADVASSVRLSDDRYLWLFGDTLLGTVSDHCTDDAFYCDRDVPDMKRNFINNSIGVATRGDDGSFQPIVKYWRSQRGRPAAIFAASRRGEFLWPLAAAVVDGQLFVAMSRHSYESGLASYGNDLLRVRNPSVPPDRWVYTRHPLPNVVPSAGAGPNVVPLSWATALVRRGAHLYVLGQRGNALDGKTVLARVRVADALKPTWRPAPEYLLDLPDGRLVWSRSFDPGRLHAIGLPGTSEATVDFAPGVGWYSYQIPALTYDVRLYTARDLVGPWSDRGIVYSIPAPWSTAGMERCAAEKAAPAAGGATGGSAAAGDAAAVATPQCVPVYAAYAVKSHPELAPAGPSDSGRQPRRAATGRVLSYNVNVTSGKLPEAEAALEDVHGFYVPQMISGSAGGGGAPATAPAH